MANSKDILKMIFFYLVFLLSFSSLTMAYTSTVDPDLVKQGDQFADLKNPNFMDVQFVTGPYEVKSEQLYNWNYPNEFTAHDLTGYIHAPNTRARQIKRTKTEIIFDAVYTFDEFGRRATPVKKLKSHNKFISLFGCSFTYGHGLNDNETLNYHIASLQKNYYPYNYGIGAGAIHQQLALINTPNFMSDVKETEGAFVYVFLDDHVNRALGKAHNIAVMSNTPYFEENELGEMVTRGTFKQVRPIYTNSLIWIHKMFGNNILKGRYFPNFGKSDEIKFCKIVTQTKKDLQKKFPKSPFIFYVHPFTSTSQDLQNCLVQNGVNYKQGERFNDSAPFHLHRLDSHPGAVANKISAQEILTLVQEALK